MAAAVEIEGLVVRYGDRTAVDGVSLAVGEGEVVALLGRNGAGKTSTAESAEGYRRRAGGTIRVLGLDPGRRADHRRLRSRLGVMLQGGGAYPGMAPGEALRLFASYYDRPDDPRDLIERLELGAVESTPWRRLSGGEQQRLLLGLALVGRPQVAFLDEPTAGVDPGGRLAIRAEIGHLRERGAAVLVTTHELDEAERVADRVVILRRGRVVASGSPAALAAAGRPEVRFSAPAGIETAALSTHLAATVTELEPGRYSVGRAGDPVLVARLTAWLAERDLALSDLRTGRRLEEVFLELTGER